MALTNVKNGKKKPKNRRNKVNLVFDEAKRRDFLTGFHKRKLQRKKHAQEKLEKELKEERKRLKAEAKESYKKLVVSHRDIPELKNLFNDEYEEDDVTVKVVELSTDDIARRNNLIGANQPRYEYDDETPHADTNTSDEEEAIPGMELKSKLVTAKKKVATQKNFNSEKQVKKELKKQATKNIQKSKVFQKKNKAERQKQKKQSFKVKAQKEKIRRRIGKNRGHRGSKKS